MIETSFDQRVQINQIIENNIPEFLLSESPKFTEFLKQYYISQEYQGGPVDIAENLDLYLKLDNLTPEVIQGTTKLTNDVTSTSSTIPVYSTKGFPNQYGLLKVDDEIITYTGISNNTFTGCIRGFSGITTYVSENSPSELEFSKTKQESHVKNTEVINLSSLFLKEFYKKLKFSLTPGLENSSFVPDLNVSNFIKNARHFYQTKGTEESFRILFNVLYGENPTVFDLERLLAKPSSAQFSRREIVIAELLNPPANPLKLIGQTIRKSTDTETQAAVSEVEILTRKKKTYYKLSLFVGYDDSSFVKGIFNIQGKTKVLENVSIGSSIISVDSTIGFGQTGTLISGNNRINYTDKSINQFFNCTGITNNISLSEDIRVDEVVFGYEDGDLTKKVELRLTGVLSEFVPTSEIYLADQDEVISIKNLGEVIENPEVDKTYKEIFANSWIYNTSSRYQVSNISGSTFTLLSSPDKSSLKEGDYIDILKRGTQEVVVSNARITNINQLNRQIILDNIESFVPLQSLEYDIRRKIRKSFSEIIPIEFGNNSVISNVQNLYNDRDQYAYIASNSLPEYTITKSVIESILPEASGTPEKSEIGEGFLQGYNNTTLKYSQISFPSDVSFISGDLIVYEAENLPIPGLISGEIYYIEVLELKNKIRLYSSRSFIGGSSYLEFNTLPAGSGSHRFVLYQQKQKSISPQKLLRKFPLQKNLAEFSNDAVELGPVGMLINGVEITSPISEDKVYYGPLDSISVINSGKNYDVFNPPRVIIQPPDSGTQALANVVVRGSVKNITVDPQDFDLNTVVSATISGGNGSGAVLKPIISRRFREVEFDALLLVGGGGLDLNEETITFKKPHKFTGGEPIVYNSNGNLQLGIGSFGFPFLVNNEIQNKTLINGVVYYPEIVNSTSIKLYPSLNDYKSGINTIGITTENNFGIHKFRTLEKNTLRSIKVLNQGSGYENRQLYVKPVGISTFEHTVTFKNHGFNDGDLIVYSNTEVSISGISTLNKYYILKVNDDIFSLADAGVGTVTDYNFKRKERVKFSSVGTGYHIFKYPEISVTVNVSYGGTIIETINAIPTISGSIIDAYLYEQGSGYGSTSITNLKKTPQIYLKTGRDAQLKPIIRNGRIVQVDVLTGGTEYYSTPNLVIEGSGSGAILRPVVVNQKIKSIVVINSGIGYNENDTNIKVVPAGSGAILEANVRSLTINKQSRLGDEVLVESQNNLKYSWIGYPFTLAQSAFGDNTVNHSPLVGWAYDGNPIYGPYGYANPEDNTSSIKLLRPGYELDISNVTDRPPTSNFPEGFFIEDYDFKGTGDLDVHNGRFCKTPEFPSGTYAYFVGIVTDVASNTLKSVYPYFIGKTFRSPLIKENLILDQKFDFNNSNLIRNTFPYKVNDQYADNDFLIESNEFVNQISIIESVSEGSIDNLSILDPGDNYKIGDRTNFDNSKSGGGGLSALVSSLKGKEITSINTSIEDYTGAIFTWEDQDTISISYQNQNNIFDGDNITISDLSSPIVKLIGSHKVGVSTSRVTLFNNIPSNVIPRFVSDLYVSHIPNNVSVGSSLTVEQEIVRVLNIFSDQSILRVRRSDIGSAHTISSYVDVIPNTFKVSLKTEYFDSKLNDKVYFNPKQSVGVGTTAGGSIITNYVIGEVTTEVSIPTRSIYLPNHPFKTGQKVVLSKYSSSSPLIVANSTTTSSFNLPPSGSDSQTVYVINKSKNFIGLTTVVGLTTNTDGLFFLSNADDDYEYLIESTFDQVTGNIAKINSIIVTNETHNLQNGDKINLSIKPNLSVGIGTSTAIRVQYKNKIKKLVINPVGFASSAININSNVITLSSHGLKTGDKVFYDSSDSIAVGLSTGNYFVYKINNNQIQLTKTYADLKSIPPEIVNIIGVGGSRHEISLINPQILSVKNNNLVFDVSHNSLQNSKLKFYYGSKFTNEFAGLSSTSNFNIIGFGTVGVTSTARLTLNYSNDLPLSLYYNLEINGDVLSPDNEVQKYSQILFVDSVYDGGYEVSGITTNTFKISLRNYPEKLSYLPSETALLQYNTNSKNAKGGVNKLNIIFGGYNYKKPPRFINIVSSEGTNANIVAESTSIGKINKLRIVDQGFEYSSDKTLRPESYISPFIFITDSNSIKKIDLVDGGKNYTNPPNLLLKNPNTNKIVDRDSLKANTYSGAVSSIEVISPIKGLQSVKHEIVPINNSNGVGINSIVSSNSGIVTCTLFTPILGFTTSVFSVGDKVLVENVQKEGTVGSGFNSSDYDYTFFTVTDYRNTNPAVVEYSLSGLTTNPGLAKTVQTGFAAIVNKKNLPQFNVEQQFDTFLVGEQLLTSNGAEYVKRDLFITEADQEYVKVRGSYVLKKNQIFKGTNSGVIAKVNETIPNKGLFNVDYSVRKDFGWNSDTGRLGESAQILSDNDYYQNLSYTIKSTIQFKDVIDPVNRLLHSAGLKNFADTQVQSKPLVAYATTSSTKDQIILDINEEKRVDAINNYDLGIDINVFDNKSKFVKLKSKKLTGYVNCITNRVLSIDDISNRFSSKETGANLYTDISTIENTYNNYYVQIYNPNTSDVQISEIVALSNDYDVFSFDKATTTNKSSLLGDVSAILDEDTGLKKLRFYPQDPYNDDYDIKVIESTFSSSLVGIDTISLGFINLTGVNTSVGIGTTITIISVNKNTVESLFANIQIVNTANNTMNYVELFLDHDGSDTYISEYYFDTSGGISTNFIGSFDPVIEGNKLNLNFYNDEKNSVFIRSKVVGFGTTSVGIGTYRFLSIGQPAGTEKTALYQSNYSLKSGVSDVVGISTFSSTSVKSLVRVSYGKTSSLHQVLLFHDFKDVYTLQYPFLSIGSTSGIGTFGGEFSGESAILKFYPDDSVSSQLKIQSFNQIVYTDNDYDNFPSDLDYGSVNESVILGFYDGINGLRANKLEFDLKYNSIPIYAKEFNPSNTTQLDYETGIFTIPNHFFKTGEQLIYTPKSTFRGVSAISVGIGSTLNSSGIVTNILPRDVYAIRLDENQFRLSTRKQYANAGIYVTFTSPGSGNAHQLEMSKKLEKSIISIDGIVQKPISYVPISYELKNNINGSIGIADTYFSISGIGSLVPRDVLKIDDEFINVISVGIGTTSTGPITGIGTYLLVEATRGFVGSSASEHSNSTKAQLYRGSFNIVGSKIFFTAPPKGSGIKNLKDNSNLPYPFSEFSGRTYLRNDYTKNILFDDISYQFTGIAQTFGFSYQGVSTSGIETGSGVLFVNDIFQTPTTENNVGNNYFVIGSSGISSVVFTGITSANGDLVNSDFDVNQNQLPRGGLIISVGSTPGLGFAPLVGAKAKAIVGAGGTIVSVTTNSYIGTGKNVSTAYYDNNTGIVEITTQTNHELLSGDTIKLVGLGFTCPSSSGIVSYFPLSGLSASYGIKGIVSPTTFTAYVGPSTIPHTYVGLGTVYPWYNLNYGSGYRSPVSVGITDSNHTGTAANISAIVGAGGTLSFIVNSGGSGYSTSTVTVSLPQPSYENLEVIGVSRLGIGNTTETGKNLLITLDVGPVSTTGIGSTLFEVSSFKISRPGYGFQVGDVIKPVGLVTDRNLASPINDFQITVTETFLDSFAYWQFGELDYIDTIKFLQDGIRTRFPLYYNAKLLSFEAAENSFIDLNSVLLIFLNGVIQKPGIAYEFTGGSTFIFAEPPKPEDNISIFFYRGTRNEDSVQVTVNETIKIGDFIQLSSNELSPDTITQNIRQIDNIPGSDVLITNVYSDQGVDSVNYKPITWIKQKVDRVVNGDFVYKDRDSIEPQIYPTARIIKNVTESSSSIFVDDSRFFNYEENNYGEVITSFGALMISNSNNQNVSAGLTATVSIAGTIQSLTITNPGSGYEGSELNVKISAPKSIGTGIGTVATAKVSIVGGSISTPITILNPGFGYTKSAPPQVIVESPPLSYENIKTISGVEGFSGIITGITTSNGTGGNPLALKFFLKNPGLSFAGLQVGYPIFIFNTSVGSGVTSIDTGNNSIVGVGKSCLDNIYYIHNIVSSGENSEIICNIKSNTVVTGISTFGSISSPVGKFSWGRFYSLTRSSLPISIAVTGFTVDSGLSTFPTIQRRYYGLRDTGSISKKSNI